MCRVSLKRIFCPRTTCHVCNQEEGSCCILGQLGKILRVQVPDRSGFVAHCKKRLVSRNCLNFKNGFGMPWSRMNNYKNFIACHETELLSKRRNSPGVWFLYSRIPLLVDILAGNMWPCNTLREFLRSRYENCEFRWYSRKDEVDVNTTARSAVLRPCK